MLLVRLPSYVMYICIITAFLYVLCGSNGVHAMVSPSPHQPTTSRRALVTRMPWIVIGAATTSFSGTTVPSTSPDVRHSIGKCEDVYCQCSNCRYNIFRSQTFAVNAYERRDVGDETASAETKAMNDQAYETNNRLERDGLVLETAAEQSAKLTAALSDYTYSPTPSKNTATARGTNKKKQSSKAQD